MTAGPGVDESVGGRAGHALCSSGICGEANSARMPCRWRFLMADGTVNATINAQARLSLVGGQCRLGRERVENPLAVRKGVPRADESLRVPLTRLAGGKRNSIHQFRMGCNQ